MTCFSIRISAGISQDIDVNGVFTPDLWITSYFGRDKPKISNDIIKPKIAE